MILTTLCCSCFFLSIILLVYAIKKWDDSIGGWIIFVLFGIWFVINLICLNTCRLSTISDIKEFESIRLTITQQRKNTLTEYERATLSLKIVDSNKWLAKEQFWANNKWLNWYYDKKILDVKPIE